MVLGSDLAFARGTTMGSVRPGELSERCLSGCQLSNFTDKYLEFLSRIYFGGNCSQIHSKDSNVRRGLMKRREKPGVVE